MRPSPGSRLFRLAAGCLAATGLLGHGLAMLLVAVLAQASAEAAYVGYGVLCTADGGAASGEPAEHPSHPLELCPVCTAFSQVTPADLPPAFLAALPEAEVLALLPAQDARPAAADLRAAPPRGPPAVA